MRALLRNTDEYLKLLGELTKLSPFTDVSALLKQLREIQDLPIVRRSDIFQPVEWLRQQTPEAQMARLRSGGGPPPIDTGAFREQPGGGASTTTGRAGVAWGETLAPREALIQRSLAGLAPANLAEANAFADKLEATYERFEEAFPNGYFNAVVLRMEIPYLRIGARTAEEAKQYIRGFAPAFIPGFQKALTEPGLPAAIRSLTNEAIRILQTGEVSGAGGGGAGGGLTLPTTAPRLRPAPEDEVIRAVTAGIGGVAPATTGGLGAGATPIGSAAGLGAHVATREDVAGVTAAINRVATDARAASEHSRAARDDQRRIVEANQRLSRDFSRVLGWEGNFLRPMRDDVRQVRHETRLAVGTARSLAEALERLQFSGSLSGNT